MLIEGEMVHMVIEGETDATWNGVVRIDGKTLTPQRAQVVNKHPTGFSWGYRGAAPEQLALAILLEAGLSDNEAMSLKHEFKNAFIAPLVNDAPFAIDVDVNGWLAGQRRSN